MKPLVVIPTYNEAGNIPKLLPAILAVSPAQLHILVVDDSSPDGTGEVVRTLAAQHPGRISLLTRPGKGGLAAAYLAGFQWGLQAGYDLLVEMDGDFSHSPQDLPALLSAAASAPAVVGSRYHPQGKVVGWSRWRNFLSRCGSAYARFILQCPVRDMTGGFNLWSAEALRRMDLATIKARGYFFQVEMKYRAFKCGVPLQEVPITFTDRTAGKSKFSAAILWEALISTIILRCS